MTTFLYILTFALGCVLGGFIVYKFNPKDINITGRNRAKKGGVIDFGVEYKEAEKEKKKLFNFKNRRKQKWKSF